MAVGHLEVAQVDRAKIRGGSMAPTALHGCFKLVDDIRDRAINERRNWHLFRPARTSRIDGSKIPERL